MARKLEVWGGLTKRNGEFVRTIVAAHTKKMAMELLCIGPGAFRDFWSKTGNTVELATALPKPGTVFVASTASGKDFVEAFGQMEEKCS